ncbi:MAG TPA: integrase core domain-containing protein [Pseudonocardiaceae bacterium]|nr:integrase core domain-containing protein [Pseudonocardiaceae bacterium]
MERWIGSLRRELLDCMLILNARHLRRVLAEYEHHFNTHRPHRSLGQAAPLRALPQPDTTDTSDTKIIRRDRRGGIIHEYMHRRVGRRGSGTHTAGGSSAAQAAAAVAGAARSGSAEPSRIH